MKQNDRQLDWLLDGLVTRVANIRQAVILTRDGLTVGKSEQLSREDAEHLAALASSVQSLARNAGHSFQGGNVRQTIIEMESAFLFVAAAGHGTNLAVLADAEADAGLIAYEMAMLVKRVGTHLATRPRNPDHEPATG